MCRETCKNQQSHFAAFFKQSGPLFMSISPQRQHLNCTALIALSKRVGTMTKED